jgi:transcriptional regulator with PAS, ATPase and Fis domain
MVARAIHQTSERQKNRLVSINCAAIPETLLESELFGHVKGAFTGADRDRKGLFASADGGTLLLDEIGDMPMRMQVDLLRALQEKTIHPIGAQKDISVDVRVLAASNKSLARLVQEKRFREDLYYRLNVVLLKVPPLRERADDIPMLVEHFLNGISTQMKISKKKISTAALRYLMEYPWPGNIRQLEHTLMNASVLVDNPTLEANDFTLDAPLAPQPSSPSPLTPQGDRDEEVSSSRGDEREQILNALKKCNWNKSRAAKQLGIPRRTFYRRLKEYGV